MKSIIDIINENLNGCTFISVDTETSVKVNRNYYPKPGGGAIANPHWNKVTKQNIGLNVMIAQYKNTNAYENMVNKRLEKEGRTATFKSGGLLWGERVPNTPFIKHGEKMYLQCIVMHGGTQVHLVSGVPTPKEKVKGISVRKGPSKESQKGLKDKVIVRTFDVKNIKKIVIGGKVLVAGVDFTTGNL